MHFSVMDTLFDVSTSVITRSIRIIDLSITVGQRFSRNIVMASMLCERETSCLCTATHSPISDHPIR